MNCKNCRTDLIGFVRGTLPKGADILIREHLEACPDCRSFADFLRSTLDVVQVEKQISPDPFLATRIEGLLSQPASRVQNSWLPKLIPALAFSLIIMAGVAGGIGLGSLLTPDRNNQNITAQDMSIIMDDLRQEPIESFLMGL